MTGWPEWATPVSSRMSATWGDADAGLRAHLGSPRP
jgi:hypothetical protein